jgi:hypothetical protein
VNPEFVIEEWAAWAPGLAAPAQWRAWSAQPTLPQGDDIPELAQMPPMARRRLDPLGRMAAEVAWSCQRSDLGMPVVLASRYGDARRSLEMLGTLARGEPVSPTAFGLSVHNAVGAMYSIARQDRSNYLSVAAGAASAAAALVEAAGLLADGAPQVLVVCYDAPLPGAYAAFQDEPAARYAWAWRVAAPSANEPRYRLEASASAGSGRSVDAALPFGLDVLRFMLAGDRVLERAADSTLWRWSRE